MAPTIDQASLGDLSSIEAIAAEQTRLASLEPSPWPGAHRPTAGGVFVAFARGQQGPGRAGDSGFVGAAATRGTDPSGDVVVPGRAGGPYRPGYLVQREGPMIVAALLALFDLRGVPDVILVDATGRDHPRRAGLALHVGAALGVPSVGVTHRPLGARGELPPDDREAVSALWLDEELVGYWYRPHRGVRPVAVHAGWRTDPAVALEVVRSVTASARTPEPLRLARCAARTARAEAALRG